MKWKFVFEKDRAKLERYFGRPICSQVYIRLYVVYKGGKAMTFFQMSGDDVCFSSVPVRSDKLFKQIREDFPFVKTFYV